LLELVIPAYFGRQVPHLDDEFDRTSGFAGCLREAVSHLQAIRSFHLALDEVDQRGLDFHTLFPERHDDFSYGELRVLLEQFPDDFRLIDLAVLSVLRHRNPLGFWSSYTRSVECQQIAPPTNAEAAPWIRLLGQTAATDIERLREMAENLGFLSANQSGVYRRAKEINGRAIKL
jgi:hypothetical protein